MTGGVPDIEVRRGRRGSPASFEIVVGPVAISVDNVTIYDASDGRYICLVDRPEILEAVLKMALSSGGLPLLRETLGALKLADAAADMFKDWVVRVAERGEEALRELRKSLWEFWSARLRDEEEWLGKAERGEAIFYYARERGACVYLGKVLVCVDRGLGDSALFIIRPGDGRVFFTSSYGGDLSAEDAEAVYEAVVDRLPEKEWAHVAELDRGDIADVLARLSATYPDPGSRPPEVERVVEMLRAAAALKREG